MADQSDKEAGVAATAKREAIDSLAIKVFRSRSEVVKFLRARADFIEADIRADQLLLREE